MEWLSERVDELSAEAARARRVELLSFDGGYERERVSWQTTHTGVDIEGTEQASLESFEDVDDRYLATKQAELLTDGGG